MSQHQIVGIICLLLLTLLTANVCNSLSNTMSTTFKKKQQEKQLHGRWLVVDFDGTCSARDTTPLLPKLAHMLDGTDSTDLDQRLAEFSNFEKEYFRLYENAKTTQLCPQTQTLDEALDTLDQISSQITAKVSASGVLKGLCVPSSEIRSLIQQENSVREHVMLLPGCLDVLSDTMKRKREENPWKLGVLSINWCPSLIDAALLQPLSEQLESDASSSSIPIWSNTVDESGVVSLRVPGASAKRDRIMKLLEWEGKEEKKKEDEFSSRCVIYIGDSSTDLLALVAANIGILIGGSKSTAKMTEQWGISLCPLTEWSQEKKEGITTIWTAESWKEIGEFLKKID